MLTRHAIWGNKRHVDYYSSKASLYNATRSLARDYPFFTFVNFMLGPIGYQKDDRHPEIIWNEIQNIIFNKQIKNYREVYFESFIFVIKVYEKSIFFFWFIYVFFVQILLLSIQTDSKFLQSSLTLK